MTGDQPATRVLIGFAEALAAPEVAASLLGAGYEVVAFTRRSAHAALRHHSRVETVDVPSPEEGVAAAADGLAALPARLGIGIVVPLDDPSVWLCQRAFTRGRAGGDPLIVGPMGPQAELAMDKRAQLVAAEAAGFTVPAWADVDPGAGLPPSWAFPVVVKPILAAEEHDGRLRRLSPRLVGSAAELEDLAASWGSGTKAVVQRWVEGRGEGIFGLADWSGVHHTSAHVRVRMMNPSGSGSSACASAPVPGDLLPPVDRLMKNAGWTGMFMVELLRAPDGTAYFMELNGRSWGSMALARRLGLEYPAWAVAGALQPGAELPPPPPFRALTCRHLGRELVHLLFILRGRPASAPLHWPARGRTLLDLRPARGQRWYNWSRRHPAVFLYDSWRTVFDQVKGGTG